MRLAPALLTTLAAGLLGACANQQVGWAMQHGTLDLTEEGVEGYQVWEMFNKRWRKKKKDKHHLCARVQAIEGRRASGLSGCPGCTATYHLSTEEVETDCQGQTGELPGLDGVTHFSFGPLPADIGDGAPYPGDTMGWYASWDGNSLELMGYLWNARLDDGDPPEQPGMLAGERYVFWPAYAWDVGSDQ